MAQRHGKARSLITLAALWAILALACGCRDTPELGRETATAQNRNPAPHPHTAAPQQRDFDFTYAATITGLSPAQHARVWIPVPLSTGKQTVQAIAQQFPAAVQAGEEPKCHNRMLYFQAAPDAAGQIAFSITYHVVRAEINAPDDDSPTSLAAARDGSASYLEPDANVPVGGKPLALLADRPLPADQLQLAHCLYDVVDDHMVYRKDKPGWGRGDAVWACESGFGNCTDFHSLFISLARAEHIPAKFEMGFLIPEARGAGKVNGYHCWAFFLPAGHAWTPVDISEANQHPELRGYYFGHLTADRVAFSNGRDLTLVPQQDGPPLNFFVYPYVEVDGKPFPAEKIERRFSYEDRG